MVDALFPISIQTVKGAVPKLRKPSNDLLRGGVEALQEEQTLEVQTFLDEKQTTYPQLVTEGSKNFILATALSEVGNLDSFVLDPSNREKLLELDPSELKDLSKILLAYAVAHSYTFQGEISPKPEHAVNQALNVTDIIARCVLAADVVMELAFQKQVASAVSALEFTVDSFKQDKL